MGNRTKRSNTRMGLRQFNRLCCYVGPAKTGGRIESRGGKTGVTDQRSRNSRLD